MRRVVPTYSYKRTSIYKKYDDDCSDDDDDDDVLVCIAYNIHLLLHAFTNRHHHNIHITVHIYTCKRKCHHRVCVRVLLSFISSLSLFSMHMNEMEIYVWYTLHTTHYRLYTTHMYVTPTYALCGARRRGAIGCVCVYVRWWDTTVSVLKTLVIAVYTQYSSIYYICAYAYSVCVLTKWVEFKTRAQQNGHQQPNYLSNVLIMYESYNMRKCVRCVRVSCI